MDKIIFTEKIVELSDSLYRMARSILLDEEKAKDAVQDLLLKLWEKREKLDRVENLPLFALKSLRNLCLDNLRKKIVTNEIPQELLSTGPDLVEQLEQKYISKVVTRLINELPELQRSVMRLRDVEGYEIKEISFIMSSNENAVLVNLSRARKKIKEQLLAMKIKNL